MRRVLCLWEALLETGFSWWLVAGNSERNTTPQPEPTSSFSASPSQSTSAVVLLPWPVPTTAHHKPWSPHTHRMRHRLSQQGQKANTRLRTLVWLWSAHLSNTSHDCTRTGVIENVWFMMTGGRWCCQLFSLQRAIRVT